MELRQVEMFIRRTGHPERRMILPRGEVVLGRAEDADVVLSDVGVSRRHAKVVVGPAGVQVQDLESGNGTFMGARKITTAALKDGDEVRIDPFVLAFRVLTEAARVAPAPMALPTIARLEVISAHAIGKGNFTLPAEGLLSLGRAENNDIVLPEPSSSRNHAEVQGHRGTWIVRDRASANGTLVNGAPVTEHTLQEGDRIMIGAVEFRFTQTLAPVEAEFGDRTEQFDGVIDAADAPVPVRALAAAPTNVATRLSTAPTHVGAPAAPPVLPGHRTMPPGELPREMPFSRRENSLPPAPAPALAERRVTPAAPPPAPPHRAPEARDPIEPYRSSPPKRRGFLSNPVNQISLGVVLFAMCLVGAWVVKEVGDVLIGQFAGPAATASAPATPEVSAAATRVEPPPSPAPPVEEPEAAVPPETPAPVARPPEPVIAVAEPTPVNSPSAPSAPVAASASVASGASAALGATAGSPRVAVPAGAPAPKTEAERLVVGGRAMLDEGRLFDAAAAFFKAVQLEPTNTSAEHWGYAACELIAFDHMRGAMKGVAPPVAPAATRGR